MWTASSSVTNVEGGPLGRTGEKVRWREFVFGISFFAKENLPVLPVADCGPLRQAQDDRTQAEAYQGWMQAG